MDSSITLQELRKSKGISLTFISKELGFKYPSAYQNIEKGKRDLRLQEAKILSDILNIQLEDLLVIQHNSNLVERVKLSKRTKEGTHCEGDSHKGS